MSWTFHNNCGELNELKDKFDELGKLKDEFDEFCELNN